MSIVDCLVLHNHYFMNTLVHPRCLTLHRRRRCHGRRNWRHYTKPESFRTNSYPEQNRPGVPKLPGILHNSDSGMEMPEKEMPWNGWYK